MQNEDYERRINAEWVTLSAVRGMIKMASRGDIRKSTYDRSLELGGAIYPELLGDDVSLLKRDKESDTTKEFRQKAEMMSAIHNKDIKALDLVISQIQEYEELISYSKGQKADRKKTDQLKRKLRQLEKAKEELEPRAHSENQLIFRDAYNVARSVPELTKGHGYRDFELADGKVLRIRVLHPDAPEHITGADIIYERHITQENKASIVAIQYKIWDEKKLYLKNERLKKQLEKMANFLCQSGVCEPEETKSGFRFPFCSAFIRPTDRLQLVDPKYLSTGEHLPVCMINECKTIGSRGAELLEYSSIKDISVSGDMFESLFNKGKLGSRYLNYDQLIELYGDFLKDVSLGQVVIHAQEF